MPKKILVVDDEPHIVKTLKDRLEFAGYNVITAHDGKEGIAKVKEESPDLILLDILMPEIDGYKVCEKLKSDSNTKKIPIIVITCLDDEKSAIKAIESGAKGYITKPFEKDSVLFTIEKFLG